MLWPGGKAPAEFPELEGSLPLAAADNAIVRQLLLP